MRVWVIAGTLASGAFALMWLVLRSGARPSRMAYPCQQAAMTAAAAAFGVPLASTIVAARWRLIAAMRTTVGRLASIGLATLGVTVMAIAANDPNVGSAPLAPRAEYRPDVYLVSNARGVESGRHGGVDDLVALMGRDGLKLHRSTTTSLTGGPNGLIDPDDVVLIKVNGQWTQRGGTNTDVLRGLIRNIVEHPDGFTGEIVVADNGQGGGTMNPAQSNAEDTLQSTQDVVDDFADEGWTISTFLWDTIRATGVDEFDVGDAHSGYIVDADYDPQTQVKTSYPKFTTMYGTDISYKRGVWSSSAQSYEHDRLVVINAPVLKTHMVYGVTAAVKNHMGVITTRFSTDAHYGVARGGLGSFLADVRRPDLNILDAIWILARPGLGPSASYAAASRRDQLVAGVDPVALDVWATKNIMIPQIVENGFAHEDYRDTQDPDNPDSVFRTYLDRSMNELLISGIDATNDPDAVTLHVTAGGDIPAVSSWGMVVTTLLLLTAGSLTLRRPTTAPVPQRRAP